VFFRACDVQVLAATGGNLAEAVNGVHQPGNLQTRCPLEGKWTLEGHPVSGRPKLYAAAQLVRISAKPRLTPFLGQRRISVLGPDFQPELVNRRELTNSFKALEEGRNELYYNSLREF
jgi:hypothetical protein